MVINPFYLMLCLYFLFNAVALILGVLDGGVLVEIEFIEFDSIVLLYSFLIQVFFLFLLLVFYFLFFNSKNPFNEIHLSSSWGRFLLVIQVLYLAFSYYYGVNIAGNHARVEGFSILNYLFIIFQVDILFLIVSVLLKSERLFWLNLLFYLFSMLLRGWMGGFLIAFILYLSRFYPLRISFRLGFLLSVIFLFLLIFLPVLVDVKWHIRSGGSIFDFMGLISDSFSLDKYIYSYGYLVNRFQHLGHVALLLENSSFLHELYKDGVFYGYWLDGLPQYYALKLFGVDGILLNSFMVGHFWGDGATWNTNPGLAGWFAILGVEVLFMLIYMFLIVAVPYYLIRKYAGNSLFLISASFSVVFLFHGWFGAYLNFIVYSMLFILIKKVRI